MRITRLALRTACLLTALGCRESVAPDQMRLALQSVTQNTSGVVDDFTESPPVVRAVNALDDNAPVSGVVVEFRPFNTQQGFVGKAWDTTDAEGLASAGSWRLGIRAGTQTLLASAYGRNASTAIVATARPASPAFYKAAVRVEQFMLAGWQPFPPAMRVTDRYDNGIPGFSVSFGVAAGSGSIDALSASTNLSGFASAGGWRIPDPKGTYSATAAAGGTQLTFTSRRVDNNELVWYKLDSIVIGGKSSLPASYGMTAAEMAFTPFDPCICIDTQGLFFETRNYSSSQPQYRNSGLFTVAARAGWLDSSIGVSASGANLIISRLDDYYYYIITRWIYSRKP